MRYLIAAASLVLMSASASASASAVYRVNFINNAPRSIVALEVAPAGTARYRPVFTGRAPLPSGVASSVSIHGAHDGCVRDFRVTFTDGTMAHQRIDFCALR